MRPFRFIVRLIAFLYSTLTIVSAAQGGELIVNGGFETGTLSGWTTSGLTALSGGCGVGANAQDWTVSTVGTATRCADPGNPVTGTFAAYNMFDFGGPAVYRLRQSIVIPAGVTAATLSWKDSINDGHAGTPRIFSINLLNAAGSTILSTPYSYSSAAFRTGWQSHSVDVTPALGPLSGSTVVLEFAVSIPERWTGGAGMGLDDVSLITVNSPPTVASIPTLGELALLMLALTLPALAMWRQRKCIAPSRTR